MTEFYLPPLSENAPLALLFPYEPDAALILDDTESISQREFLRDVWAQAQLLPRRAYVINLCEDRYCFLVSFCAALVNGSINLLPPNRQSATLASLLADYPDSVIACDDAKALPALDQHPSAPAIPAIFLREQLARPRDAAPSEPTLPEIPAMQIAALAFTSGSTGKPQARAKHFGSLAGLARMLGEDLLGHAAIDTQASAPLLLATVPSQHMYGLETTIFMALQTRACLHRDKPFFPADIHARLSAQFNAQRNPALLITTPTHLRALTQAELAMPPALAILSATAPLDVTLARAAETAFAAPLFEIYGCTEAGSMALRQSTQREIWQLLPGFSFTQDAGITTAAAPHLPEATPLQDVIELTGEREFLLRGRGADMINVAGKRASLAQLSQVLLDIPGVTDAAVFMLETAEANAAEARPVALAVSSRPARELVSEFAALVDGAFVPRPLKIVPQLPRNETGKLTRTSLLALWRSLDVSHV